MTRYMNMINRHVEISGRSRHSILGGGGGHEMKLNSKGTCVSCPNFKTVLFNLKAYINQTFYIAIFKKKKKSNTLMF